MASGCIIGDCPECGNLVWEDDWIVFDDKFMHSGCRPSYIRKRTGLNEEQYERLTMTKELQKELKDTQKLIADSFTFWRNMVDDLERRIEEAKAVDQ